MRRVLWFLVLGFRVVVAMILDEGNGVALPVVSNSETRSRGQGMLDVACTMFLAVGLGDRGIRFGLLMA
ncbi:hypothetical protein Tco_1130082 [Tanacetum coccineum]